MHHTTLKTLMGVLIALLILALVWDAALFLQSAKDTPWNFTYNIMYSLLFFFGGVVGVWYVRTPQGKGTFGRALAFIGLGLIAWGLGLLVWAYYNFFSNVEIPYPSLADILFVFIYPGLGIGVWYLLKIYRPLITTRLIAESILIVLVAIAITVAINGENLKAFQAPYDPGDPETEGLSLMQKFFTFFYPLGDIAILSGALIILRVGGGKIQRGVLLLIAGMVLMTIADYLFTYRTIQETYWNGDIADAFYTLAAFMMSFGIITSIKDLTAHNTPSPTLSTPVVSPS